MTPTTKNAPVELALEDRGESTTTLNGVEVMPNVAHDDLKDETWFTVPLLDEKPTPEEVDWAEQHLACLPVVEQFDLGDTAEFVDIGDDVYRYGGCVRVAAEDPTKIRIMLASGATAADLKYLRSVVERAQGGRFLRYGWEAATARDGGVYYRYCLARRYKEPESVELVPCLVDECVDTWHYRWDVLHTAESESVEGLFMVEVQRYDDDTSWSLFVDLARVVFPAQSAQQLAQALLWQQQTVERLNAQMTERREA